MLLVASFDDLMRPQEEHFREKVGVLFKARLVRDLAIDLVFDFMRLLLHVGNTNYKSFNPNN
jgi:hypothetical protein